MCFQNMCVCIYVILPRSATAFAKTDNSRHQVFGMNTCTCDAIARMSLSGGVKRGPERVSAKAAACTVTGKAGCSRRASQLQLL